MFLQFPCLGRKTVISQTLKRENDNFMSKMVEIAIMSNLIEGG